jgi:hypothetical protein
MRPNPRKFAAIKKGALLFFAWLADEVLEGATQSVDESIRAFVVLPDRPPNA